jgi:putative transposase
MPDAGYKIRNAKEIHFITFAVVEWVDVFTRKEYRDIYWIVSDTVRKKKD